MKAIASPAYIVASLEYFNEVSADFFCPVKKLFEFACEANFRKATIPEYKREYEEIENRWHFLFEIMSNWDRIQILCFFSMSSYDYRDLDLSMYLWKNNHKVTIQTVKVWKWPWNWKFWRKNLYQIIQHQKYYKLCFDNFSLRPLFIFGRALDCGQVEF